MVKRSNISECLMFRRCERGTASVEAVIALPVLILILVSLIYVRDQVVARQAAEQHARSCAWRYSANNCVTVPKGCSKRDLQLVKGMAKGHASSDIYDAVSGGKDAMKAHQDSRGVVGDIADKLLGPALDAVFGSSVKSRARRPVTRPGLYGGGTLQISGRYYLACNLKHEKPLDVVNDAWSMVSP